MSDATRDVLIRITTEVKSTIKAPDFDAITTGHKQVKKAADDVAAAVTRTEQSIKKENDSIREQVQVMKGIVEALPKESDYRKQLQGVLTQTIMLREREVAAMREQEKQAATASAAAEARRVKTRDILVSNRLDAYHKNKSQEEHVESS